MRGGGGNRAANLRATGAGFANRALGRDALRTALVLIGIGFVLRLALFPLGNFTIDTNTMTSWAQRLVDESPRSFYTSGGLTDHLPGDLWILWLIGHVYSWFAPITTDTTAAPIPFLFMLKLVPAIADAVIALLIFLIGRRLSTATAALVAVALYVFNPAAIFIGSVWTQWDSLSAMAGVGAIYLFIRGRPEYAIPAIVYACLIKPQLAVFGAFLGLAFLLVYIAPHVPALARWVREDGPRESLNRSLTRLGIGAGLSLAVFLVVCLPFNIGLFPGMGAFTIWDRIDYALNVYQNTTLNAPTIWGVFSENWADDTRQTAIGLSYQATGTILAVLAITGIAWLTLQAWRRFGYQALIWGMTAASFAAYMLPTRGHERYLFPTMVLTVLLVALLPRFIWLYAGITASFTLTLYWVYSLYFPSETPQISIIGSSSFLELMAVLNIVLLAATIAIGYALVVRGNTFSAPRWVPGWMYPDGSVPASAPVRGARPAPKRDPLVEGEEGDASVRDFVHADAEAAARPAWQVWYLPLAIAVIGAVFYLIRIDIPDDYIYDEVYHAFTAAQYVDGNENTFDPFQNAGDDGEAGLYTWYPGDNGERTYENFSYEWTHPPLGKEIIAIGIWLFGDNPFGWRFTSWIFGALGLFIVYRLGMALTGRWVVGAVAAGLLLVDGLYFVQSRTSMVDIHIVVFIMAALWAFLRYMRVPVGASTREVGISTLLLGLAMGAAFATKWNGLYPIVFMVGVALLRLAWIWIRASPLDRDPEPRAWSDLKNHLVFVPLNLILLPLAVYFVSYVPMFLFGFSFADFVELQRQMLYYHTVGVVGHTHSYYSLWWQWPLAMLPVWFGTQDGPVGGDTRGYVFNQVNPFIAWSMIPALIAVIWLWLRDYRRHWIAALVLLIGFFGQWLIWSASPRGAYAYHFLPMVPFGILAIATLVEYGWRVRELPLAGRTFLQRYRIPLALVGVGVLINALLIIGVQYPLPNDKVVPDDYVPIALYGLPVALFGLVAIAIGAGALQKRSVLSLRNGAITYAVLAVLVFAFLFPILAATQLTQQGLDLRTWLPGWTVR
jgi:dolichyl-phosphate-mannose--protein O-mannosyl transferase